MISIALSISEITIFLSIISLYIVQCPFNKVEESFNTQAIHDILNLFPNSLPSSNNLSTANELDLNQLNRQQTEISIRDQQRWDHTEFPGVVPRTFVGALLIGIPLKLAKYFMIHTLMAQQEAIQNPDRDFLHVHDLTLQFIMQILARFGLASLLVVSIVILIRAVHRRYGLGYRLCFLCITITQFHYNYYASRFIPNTFAAILANLVFASWLARRYSVSIVLMAACVIIFRFDTCLFFGVLLLDAIFIRRILNLRRVLTIGIPASLLSIVITLVIDSVFWTRPVWPELESLYFNVWLNKSHEWGIEPYFWYVYSCVPRIMLAATPLILVAEHRITRAYLIPTLVFIFMYSLLPHKELRFVLFINPLLNVCAASGLMNIYYYINKLFLYLEAKLDPYLQEGQANLRDPSTKGSPKRHRRGDRSKRNRYAGWLFGLIVFIICFANLFACLILSRISSKNYPGGEATLALGLSKELLDTAKITLDNPDEGVKNKVGVYINNLAAQTGVSRFIQVDGAYYSKTPTLDSSSFKSSYILIYLLLEPKEVDAYFRNYCRLDQNQEQLIANNQEKWEKNSSEIKCRFPNQKDMYCSLVSSVNSFRSFNLGALIESLKKVDGLFSLIESLFDRVYIKTKVALHTIRCSTRSKF